jgi:4-hydroxy-2-oxoglutarate aldolase
VADNSPIPILLYNVPKFTGIDISPSLVRLLSQHPNIIGIKNSTNKISHFTEMIKNRSPNFHVLIGSYTVFLTGLLMGADGAVLAIANVAANACVEIYQLFGAKSHNQARQIYFKLFPLAKALTQTYGIPAIKAALDLLGFYGGKPRAPLLPLTQEKIDEIRRRLKEAELL